jgi:hypothetical protein
MRRMRWSWQQYLQLPEGYLEPLQQLLEEEERQQERR